MSYNVIYTIAGVTPSDHALVFVDNHETQRTYQSGIPQLSFREPKSYTMATAFTLAYDYGFVRLMSSYNFTDADSGPPSHTDLSTKVNMYLAVSLNPPDTVRLPLNPSCECSLLCTSSRSSSSNSSSHSSTITSVNSSSVAPVAAGVVSSPAYYHY